MCGINEDPQQLSACTSPAFNTSMVQARNGLIKILTLRLTYPGEIMIPPAKARREVKIIGDGGVLD